MYDCTADQPIEQLGKRFRDVSGYLPLPYAAMREVGSAVFTLGAMFRLSHRHGSLFLRVDAIADTAGVHHATADRHFRKLEEAGLTDNLGRQRGEGCRVKRRTASRTLTDKAWQSKKPYGTLPGWFTAVAPGRPAAAMIYSVILGRYCRWEANGGAAASGGVPLSWGDIGDATGLPREATRQSLVWLATSATLIRITPSRPSRYGLILPEGTAIHGLLQEARQA